MKNPVLTFTSIAAIAAAALGVTLYLDRKPAEPMAKLEAPAQADKKPDAVAKVEPVAPAPVEQQAAAPKPSVTVAPEAEKKTEVAVATPPAKVVEPEQPQLAVAAPDKAPEPEQPQPVVAAPDKAPEPEQPQPVVAAPDKAPEPVQPKVAVTEPAPQPAVPVSPSFDTVRVEATGDAIIAGRAAPNADVTVKWNGNIVGTTTANADGSFVVVPAKALKTGIGAMTIESMKDGQRSISEGSVFVVVKKGAPATIAKVEPQTPTQVVQSGAVLASPKDLQLTSVDYDTAGNIVFSGIAAAGAIVRFYVDNIATGEGTADANGRWSFAGTSSIKPGTHTLRADQIDIAGKVVNRIELPFLRETVETVVAAQVADAAPKESQPVARSVVVAPAAPVVETVPVPTPQVETQVVAAPAPVVEEVPRKLVIQPGNNLWKLSREVYGKGRMFTIIYEANRDQVKNPNRIYPGQILTAPKQN